MDDIVHRLREIGFELSADYYPIVFDAADEIERLRKQVEMTRSDKPDVDDTPHLLSHETARTPLPLSRVDDIVERPIRTAAEKYIADCVSQEAGIVERLRDMLDGPVPMYVTRQDIRDIINEIERLYQKEYDILAGIQLVVKGSNAGRDKEIERLQATLAGWSQDISNLEDENEQLNTKIVNLQAHIQWLTQVAQERIHG